MTETPFLLLVCLLLLTKPLPCLLKQKWRLQPSKSCLLRAGRASHRQVFRLRCITVHEHSRAERCILSGVWSCHISDFWKVAFVLLKSGPLEHASMATPPSTWRCPPCCCCQTSRRLGAQWLYFGIRHSYHLNWDVKMKGGF